MVREELEMRIKIYHGSEQIITKPEYGKGNPRNDYGRGFYCTQYFELAGEWACRRKTDGFVNAYQLDLAGLHVLDLNGPGFSVLNWLAVLARHRTYWQRGSIAEEAKNYIEQYFLPDLEPYDVICGYRADDSYFSFAQDFVSGAISLRKLSEAMRLGDLGVQIVLKSERAFESLEYIESAEAPADHYYPKKAERDLQARRRYRTMKTGKNDSKDDLYILDILREEMRADDPRLR